MWKHTVEPDRQQITIQFGAEKIQFAHLIIKASKETHSYNISYYCCMQYFVMQRESIVVSMAALNTFILLTTTSMPATSSEGTYCCVSMATMVTEHATM
jgi:hypothetical protein